MPLQTMEDPNWKCPHCQRTCSTGACRRDPRQHPYEPKGTLLGHDTKRVADPRSVECLVDFSVSNLNWLREDEGTDGPMQRRRDEAERSKMADPSQDHRFIDDDFENGNGIAYSPTEESIDVNYNGVAGNSGAVLGNEYGSYYPDPDMNGDIPRLGKRNRDVDEDEQEAPRRKKSKKGKKGIETGQPLQPKNVSGKQYQKEINKKIIDDAKKNNRYVIVTSRMKGKSKIVKLSLPSYLLAQFRKPHDPEMDPEREPEEDVEQILESDILRPKPAPKASGAATKASKSFRVRVDQDATYGSGKPPRVLKRYEELEIDSDEERDDEMAEYSGPRGGKGRSSAWLARKNEGEDEDLPTELPSNFKDGTVNPRRDRDRERTERRRTMPAKSMASIRLPGHASRNSTGNMSGTHSDEDGIHEEDDTVESSVVLAQSAAAALTASRKAEEEEAEAARRAEEENILAARRAEEEKIQAALRAEQEKAQAILKAEEEKAEALRKAEEEKARAIADAAERAERE